MTRPWAAPLWTRGGPLLVMLLASLTRLVGLGQPDELIFDETYYVKDAYTLMNLGYEGAWPADANTSFNAGLTDIYSAAPSFIAHPPIGKWIIAMGLAVFGAGNSFGWRIGVAICGILLVLVTMLIAHLLFRSTLLTVIAGGLLAIDGNAIVMSRVALLDTILALMALVGVLFVLLDRAYVRRRIDGWVTARGDAPHDQQSGPLLLWRPWLLAASVTFGLASGVKWNGVYFLAAFAVYALVADLLARRAAGIPSWWRAILTQGPLTFLLTIPLAAAVYVASWTGWFVTQGGYYRQWIQNEGGVAWNGALAWVPTTFQNWWHYQATMYAYHVGESTPHNYQANPLTWLLLVRPTSMFYREYENGASAATILDVANPLIWWASSAAAIFLLVRIIVVLVKRRTAPDSVAGVSVWREAFVLVGVGAGYLPWLMYLNRTVFQFYTIAFEPYLILGLTLTIGLLLGSARDPAPRRTAAVRVVGIFLGVCLVLSVYFWPAWTGLETPKWFVLSHFWFRTWI